jgi:hypothetical protein
MANAKQGVLNDKEKVEFRQLTDYIKEVYDSKNIEPSWNFLMAQVKNYKATYKITYKEMINVLKYMVQIEDVDITDRDTLGLLPYYIDKTKRYLERYKEVRDAIKNFEFDERVRYIEPKGFTRTQRKNETYD